MWRSAAQVQMFVRNADMGQSLPALQSLLVECPVREYFLNSSALPHGCARQSDCRLHDVFFVGLVPLLGPAIFFFFAIFIR